MESKINEIITATSNLKDMKGSYLAENLFRKWNEDFVDEDTGEVVSIERSEIVQERGIFIDDDVLSEITFFIQSEDVKEVKISNQNRSAIAEIGYLKVFEVVIEKSNKKKKFYLYSHSVELALKIANDYLERFLQGGRFRFKSIKEYGNYELIPSIETGDLDANFYKIEISSSEANLEKVFIVESKNVDEAKDSILEFISEELKEEGIEEVNVLSASKIPCNNVIPLGLTEEWIKHQEELSNLDK